jgi:hypothetical protein
LFEQLQLTVALVFISPWRAISFALLLTFALVLLGFAGYHLFHLLFALVLKFALVFLDFKGYF